MRVLMSRGLAVGALIAAIFVASSAMAEVANRYAGQVILFTKRPPSRWANDGVFHRFVAQNKTGSVQAEDDGNWRVEYMAFFRRAVNDREVTVRFYDANNANAQYLTSYTLYLNNMKQRIVGGNARLERPDFAPNKYYKITVASKGKTLARLKKFALIGDEPERTGVVDFTQDE